MSPEPVSPEPVSPEPVSPEPVGDPLVELVGRARAGRPRAVARLITLVESGSPRLRELAALLGPGSGRAHVVGLTGAPGVGKSTTTTGLVGALRSDGMVVGVLAVDPSSPLTGGALLGDRIRMQEHALDPGVFIRSMASRGHLGGLAAAAPAAVRVLEAAGCDVVLVETVGVGQSEVEVADYVDTTCVLLAPGSGDAVQVAKAGVLEVGDVYVVNKADRDGAQALVRDLRTMLALAGEPDGSSSGSAVWRAPIVRTVAARGDGLTQLVEAITGHRTSQQADGGWERRRRGRARREIASLVLARLGAGLVSEPGLDPLADRVSRGEHDPWSAAEEVLEHLRGTPWARDLR